MSVDWTLGAFTLIEPLGRGGMGEIWRARHRDGTPAAIKVVGQAQVYTPEARRALRNEIRAIAGLDHPAIVAVFDAGVVDEAADDASAGTLAVGSPWVAIELCSEGSLLQCPPTDWSGLRGLLLTLLDALSHVHARGMVHRDLKPANVLRCGLDAPRPGWRLADFGVARVLHGTPSRAASTGTPRYMAPEQIRSEAWRLGPQSDLFSLGCMAWELAAGTSHRRATSLDALLQEQATEPLPQLAPVMAVPEGLSEWIAWLTQLDPDDRPGSAVDAARALLALGEPTDAAGPVPSALAAAQTFSLTAVLEPLDLPSPARRPADPRRVEAAVLPPWGLPSDDAMAVRLGDAGLGLLPHRSVPLVGRRELQDRLWQSLAGPIERGSTELIWLRGPSGVGKSRMARWLVERAAELALAHPVRVTFRGPGSDDLGRALARMHGADGLDVPSARRALARQGVDPDRAAALAGWWVERGGGAAEHAGLAASRLQALSARRGPLVVWLDDVQHRPEALLLAERLYAAEVPALVVLTTDDELIAGTELEGQLHALVDGRGWSERLGPLTGAARHGLVHAALGLEPALAADIAHRSGGNPGLALEMVHHLVAIRGLRWTSEGFGLAPRARAPTTTDRAGVWTGRLQAALDGSEAGALAVAAGALVGVEVDPTRWRAAGAALGVDVSVDGLQPLATAALVRIESDGSWCFAHPSLVAAAVQVLTDDQRRAAHRAVAEAATGPEVRAVHLLAAGEVEGALDPLVDAAEQLCLVGEQKLALRRMEQWSAAAAQVGLTADDERRVKGLSRLATIRRQLGQLEQAVELCDEVLAHAAPGSRWRAAALGERGAVAGIRGDVEDARRLLLEAAEAFEAAGATSLAEGCRVSVSLAYVSSGQPERAEAILSTLVPVDAKGRGRVARVRAVVAMHVGDTDEARARCAEARDAYRDAGNLHGAINALNDLGAIELAAGDLDAALEHLRAAAAGWDALGAYQAVDVFLNIAQIHGARGDWTECRATAAPVLAQMSRSGPRDLSLPLAVMLSAAAGLRDWPAFDAHLEALCTVTMAQHLHDVQRSLEAAEGEARAAGEADRADAVAAFGAGLLARTRASG